VLGEVVVCRVSVLCHTSDKWEVRVAVRVAVRAAVRVAVRAAVRAAVRVAVRVSVCPYVSLGIHTFLSARTCMKGGGFERVKPW